MRCKYTLGAEGGASVLDRTGQILESTLRYRALHPQADYEEIAGHCFPEGDNSLTLTAISPRHLEACATKTCQILIEGDYNGILTPGRHYIELKRDFSNIDEVLDLVKLDKQRAEIAAQAHGDIVESGLYSYRSFVNFLLSQTLGAEKSGPAPHGSLWDRFFFYWMRVTEALSWVKVALFRFILKMVPGPLLAWLRRRRQATA